MNDMIGQTVLVTGSTSGIGRAVAIRLAESGAAVALHGRNADAAEQVAEEIRRSTGSVAGVFLTDIATSDGCDELIADVIKTCPNPSPPFGTNRLISSTGLFDSLDIRSGS